MQTGIKITFSGSTGYTCEIQRRGFAKRGNTIWEYLGSARMDAAGHCEFTDLNPISVEQSQGGMLKR